MFFRLKNSITPDFDRWQTNLFSKHARRPLCANTYLLISSLPKQWLIHFYCFHGAFLSVSLSSERPFHTVWVILSRRRSETHKKRNAASELKRASKICSMINEYHGQKSVLHLSICARSSWHLEIICKEQNTLFPVKHHKRQMCHPGWAPSDRERKKDKFKTLDYEIMK